MEKGLYEVLRSYLDKGVAYDVVPSSLLTFRFGKLLTIRTKEHFGELDFRETLFLQRQLLLEVCFDLTSHASMAIPSYNNSLNVLCGLMAFHLVSETGFIVYIEEPSLWCLLNIIEFIIL